MTTNQLTYMQLQEQMRANQAQEGLKQQSVDVERDYKDAQKRLISTQVDEIVAKLPYELELSKAEIDKVKQEAERILTEDLAKRLEMGDTSAIPLSMTRTQGTSEKVEKAWNDMTTDEKLYSVTSGVREALDHIFRPLGGKGGASASDAIKLIGSLM